MTKKLYAIKDPKGILVKDLFFAKKEEAKKVRDKLSADNGFEREHIEKGDAYTVTRGPEHPEEIWRKNQKCVA